MLAFGVDLLLSQPLVLSQTPTEGPTGRAESQGQFDQISRVILIFGGGS